MRRDSFTKLYRFASSSSQKAGRSTLQSFTSFTANAALGSIALNLLPDQNAPGDVNR
jgi:hypothetical protein